MSKKQSEDYREVSTAKNVKHIVDDSGKGWFCYCGADARKVTNRASCCTPEGEVDFERVG